MSTQSDYRAEFNAFMVEGDTFGRYRFKFRTGTNPDTYEDISGCTFLADLIRDGSSVIESSTTNGRMDLEDAETFWWEISADDAAVLTQGNYTYDIKVTYPDNTVRTRFFGKLTVKEKRSE